jgi:hypothetical protein
MRLAPAPALEHPFPSRRAMPAPRLPLRRLVAAVAALLTGCAAATQHTYVAPTFDTVVSTTEERTGSPPVHLLLVENRSTVPVVVFSASLTNCENVRDSCTPHPMNVRVGPGQRQIILRAMPTSAERGFSYRFGFSWHADSSDARALSALAASGSQDAQRRLSDRQRGDSLRRAAAAAGYVELSRDDYAALGSRVAALRAANDSLVLAPGQKAGIDDIRLVLVDSAGAILGSTHWVRWRVPSSDAVQFNSPKELVGREAGRVVLTFALAEEAQALLGRPLGDVEVPVVVATTVEPDAPLFQGTALDADSRKPLACSPVALEDSAEHVVARGRTSPTGVFNLTAPRAGSYRVRAEVRGWAPVYGPLQPAASGETKQFELLVRFTEQLLVQRRPADRERFQHAAPAAVSMATYGVASGRKATSTPVVSGVTLGGSESAPVLGIIGAAPAGRAWMQFVVDAGGKVDTGSVQLPPDIAPAAAASVKAVLPRVRFTPARVEGTPVCELQRMEVAFTKR